MIGSSTQTRERAPQPPLAHMTPPPNSAEEACRRAEALFLAGDVRAAHRMAQRAQTLSPALPGVASVLAAYAVHAAAANRGGCPDWRAVLGLGRAQHRQEEPLDAGLSEHDVIRRQFRRMSLLVHPDKNPSAAAEGAFKLLRRACDALSATASHRRPTNATAASTAAAGAEKHRQGNGTAATAAAGHHRRRNATTDSTAAAGAEHHRRGNGTAARAAAGHQSHSHHRRSYPRAGTCGTYAEAASKYTPTPATTKTPTTAAAGNQRPSNDSATKHTVSVDHWYNTTAHASAAGIFYDYRDDDYHDYHDYYDYYNYHFQDDTAETYTPAAGHKDDDDTAETHNPGTANKGDHHGGSCGPREDIRIICLSCEGGLTKPVSVPVAGSECSWCGQTMTRVSGAAMN